MANVVTIGPSTVTITNTDGTWANFDMKDYFPGRMKLNAIKFYPTTTNDIIQVRDGSATGPIISCMKDVSGTGVADKFYGVWCSPYVVISECTLAGTKTVARMIFEYL